MANVTKEYPLLGKHIEITIYGMEDIIAQPLLDRFHSEALRLQKIFNLYDETSELSILNKKRKMQCSKELIEVIKLSKKYSRLTDGKYDVSKGKEFLARKKGAETKVKCSYKDISLKDKEVILNDNDVLIDLGSVAKGYIGDKLGEFLQNEGVESGFIDLRGDMVAFGDYEEQMSIQHPRDDTKTIYSFGMKNSCVATSGDYKQFYGNDYGKSHIIGSKDLISVTVIHKSLAEADAIATAIFVSGSKDLEKFSKEKYFTVTNDLEIIKSEGFP